MPRRLIPIIVLAIMVVASTGVNIWLVQINQRAMNGHITAVEDNVQAAMTIIALKHKIAEQDQLLKDAKAILNKQDSVLKLQDKTIKDQDYVLTQQGKSIHQFRMFIQHAHYDADGNLVIERETHAPRNVN